MLELELEPTALRRAVALAHARVAHHGGAFADARVRRVLDHCRAAGPHDAGCWVVNLFRRGPAGKGGSR